MRLVALAMRDNGGNPLYSAAWIPSDGRSWAACIGVSLTGLVAFYNKWSAQGMEMKLLASTETLLSAVMEATATGTKFVYDLTDGPVSSSGAVAPIWATALGARAVTDGATGLAWTTVWLGKPPAWVAGQIYVEGAMVTDSNGNLQQAKTTGASWAAPPAWSTSLEAPPVTDGDGGLTWSLIWLGTPPAWASGTTYAQGALITDSNGNLELATTSALWPTRLTPISSQPPIWRPVRLRSTAPRAPRGVTRRYLSLARRTGHTGSGSPTPQLRRLSTRTSTTCGIAPLF
jgi:hypothetical protein